MIKKLSYKEKEFLAGKVDKYSWVDIGLSFYPMDKLKSELDRPSLKFLKGLKNIVGVEIGVQYGINTKDILEKYDIKTLYLIDPYTPFTPFDGKVDAATSKEYNKFRSIAKEYLKDYKDKIIWIREYSQKCANRIPNNLDFVYIDGDHRYESTKQDIELYYPKVKNGGLIAGHDYKNSEKGVIRAVTEFFGNNVESGGKWDWWYIKGK